MMQDGDYDRTGIELPVVTRTVFIDDVRVDDSWLLSTTFEAEIASDLPEIVAGVGSTGQARFGTVVIGPRTDVDEVAPSPLNREGIWPPERGQTVVIEDGTVDQRWRRATATVVDVNAKIGEQKVTVSWRDHIDELVGEVELAPVARQMPGYEANYGGELRRDWHRTAIEPWGIVVEALEDSGYRMLPSLATVDFYNLLQGSAHPRIGRIKQAYSAGDLLEWDDTTGFQYLNQWSYFTPGTAPRGSGNCFTVYLRKTRGGPDAQTRWTMSDGSELRLTLQNSSVALSRDGVVIAQRGFTSTSPLPYVGASIAYDSVTFWLEDQMHTVDYADWIPSGGIDWDQVRVLGAAALAVNYVPRAGWPGFNWPSLRFRGGGLGLVRDTQCTRTIENETAAKVIGEISKATLTGFWMDEHGILNWVPSPRLESGPVVDSISEIDDVVSGSWSEVPDGVARTVNVAYDEVALTTRSTTRLTVKEGSGPQTMKGGDGSLEEFVGPYTDEEWIEPDMSPLPASQNSVTSMRRGLFSMWGGSYVHTEGVDEDGNPNEDATTYGWAMQPNGTNHLSISVDDLTPRRWKVTHSIAAGAPEVQLVTLPGEGTQIPVPWRSRTLPIWRARGRALFISRTVRYSRGPGWAREYSHDIGSWGSRADAQRVGDWLATRMSTPMLYANDVSLVPDPRRQLGDVVEANMTKTMGGVMRLLTVGIREITSPGQWSQIIDYRVISASPSDIKTYGQVEDRHATYATVEDAVNGTYADAETN